MNKNILKKQKKERIHSGASSSLQESKWLFPDILGEIIKRFGTFPGDIPGSVLNGFHSIFDGIACFFGGRFFPAAAEYGKDGNRHDRHNQFTQHTHSLPPRFDDLAGIGL
ncbi:hypothetical protein [Victivallis vadensis]|uniref:hypothetical protein n=1 Tax=Victivallis vadensis TaxID=172901 RepID=UPI0001572265|nr:hypothetical protein [Victivallis vadensis]